VDTTLCFGESITVNGTVYNTTTIGATEVFTNIGPFNCDSTVTVNVTVLPEKTGIVDTTLCFGESVTVNGTVYNVTTIGATEVFTNIGPFNCDST
jgi:sorbitol-specific phosphotransferase system component IIA